MELGTIDKSELILESYRIDGIVLSECRSIFLDWYLKLPDSIDRGAATRFLIDTYAKAAPDHPMSQILHESLEAAPNTGRRGGRASRISGRRTGP
ncbi:MAG: hypothetical protein V3U96_07080 [Paracoccaceae bacterium]